MKASEQSPTAANLIAELIAKLNVQDDSPLCTLLACHMAKLIGDAQTRDCQDAEAVTNVENALEQELRAWHQYESMRQSWGGIFD